MACRLSCNMWDLSSLTRDLTWALCTGSIESYPLDYQESPIFYILKLVFFCNIKKSYQSSHFLIEPMIYLYQYELTVIYFILWVIIQYDHYLFCCSNCFGYWEHHLIGSCIPEKKTS